MRSLEDNLSKLRSFLTLTLGDNNDVTFSSDFIEYISDILTKLPVQPEVYPTLSGNIQLEYESSNGKYLEFEFTPSKTYHVYKEDGNGNESLSGEISIVNLSRVITEVELFVG